MASRVYHVALAFEFDAEGELQPIHALETPTAQSATILAKRLANRAKGAVAFSRSGDSDTGEYDDAEIHLAVGDLPPDVRSYVRGLV